ncbi:MAG: hypothetical protein GXO93_06015, partial [FCB group bacterium]|nr:hypothetical protein [FCB group bacterium]
MSKFQQVDNNLINPDGIVSVRDINRTKETRNLSAGIPAWFVSLDHPTAGDIIPAGGSINLQFTVNQPLINRGPQSVYIDFDTDDPDFFLNGNTDAVGLLPEIQLTIIGGCLIDTTTLHFGIGQANSQLVSNTGRLGDGDWTPSYGFDIDGDGTSYYQGSYIYGVDKYRLAMNTKDWTSGGGEANAYISLQGDPNYCDQLCKPNITTDVPVGKITGDGGLTYSDVLADVVCKSWLDSVQNFEQVPGDASTWDWTAFGAPFDDTLTMGLYVNSEVVGVKEVPQLANLTLEIMHFENRSATDSVKNWYIGHMFD